MAAPSVNTTRPYKEVSLPFQKRQWGTDLSFTVDDEYYTAVRLYGHKANKELPKPGELRFHDAICGFGPYKNVYAQGPCWFRWCLNRSGGTLAQFSFAAQPANKSTAAADSGTVSSITDTGNFTANEERHGIVQIVDDAGGANAAPEGQWGYIVYNDANTIHFQPDLTVAVAASDTYAVWYPYNLEASADGDLACICQGVILSADGIQDDYWGWVGIKGLFSVKTANAITAGDAVVAAAGSVGASGSDPADLFVGWSPFTYQAAAAQALIFINVLNPVPDAAV